MARVLRSDMTPEQLIHVRKLGKRQRLRKKGFDIPLLKRRGWSKGMILGTSVKPAPNNRAEANRRYRARLRGESVPLRINTDNVGKDAGRARARKCTL